MEITDFDELVRQQRQDNAGLLAGDAAVDAADETVDSVVRAHIRRIFSKYKAQGLPNKKIAAILDVSENTMKKAL